MGGPQHFLAVGAFYGAPSGVGFWAVGFLRSCREHGQNFFQAVANAVEL
jgi:hypothetical protein